MTNDDFILGLLNVNVQKGNRIPDKCTDTQFLDKGMFTFLYSGDVIHLERHNLNLSGRDKDKKYWFSLGNFEKHYISKETYNKADDYFQDVNYDRLKTELKKGLVGRGERMILEFLAVFLGIFNLQWTIYLIITLAALSNLTALQRIYLVFTSQND